MRVLGRGEGGDGCGVVGRNEILDDEYYGRLFTLRIGCDALRFALDISKYTIPSLTKLSSPLPQIILLSRCSNNNTIHT
jgi:hypothetical protein